MKFALASIFVFSIMAPIGVGVGTALNFTKDADVTIEKAVVVLQVKRHIVKHKTNLWLLTCYIIFT